MKKLNLMALLLGAALFTGMGATSLSAESMKCGAGKCGNAVNKSAGKCGKALKAKCDSPKDCDTQKKCDNPKDCDTPKKVPQKAGKCGTGKCS